MPPLSRLTALQELFTLSNTAVVMAGGEFWSAGTEDAAEVPDFQTAATSSPSSSSLYNLAYTSLSSLFWPSGLLPVLLRSGFSRNMVNVNTYTAAKMLAKQPVLLDGENYFHIQLTSASHVHRGKSLTSALIKLF